MYGLQRNFGLSGNRYDIFDEPSPLDLSKDPAQNMREVLQQITSKEEMSTTKRMGCVNNFTKLIQNVDEKANLGFSYEDIIVCLKVPLTMSAKEVRAAGLRALRHLFSDESKFLTMLKLRIDLFVVRSMDTNQAYEVERVQALRFIRKVVAICPRSCSMSLAACLVSTGSDDTDDADRLKRACLATLCELALKNTALASFAGGIQAIVRNVLDCQMPRLNESLMVTLMYLLNNAKTRHFVRLDVGLEAILAPFTDLHYRHSADTPETQLKEDRDGRLLASKMALISVFRTWSGIISFCKPDGKGLQSLLGVFCLQNSEVRKGIMDIISQIFRIKEPEWTDDFNVALLSVDPSQMKESWKLSEGFVAQEGQELLPRATRATGRTNLVNNYTALVLSAFMNAGLFESLVEVITSSDCFISVRATILLGELLHLANTLLPPECSSHSHCLPTLVNTATSFEVSAAERGRASAAVNCLDRLHQLKKRGPVPCSLYLDQIVTQTRALEPKIKPDKLHKDRLLQCINKQDLEEPYLVAIRDSQVMMEKDFRNWDWDLIEASLQSPFMSLKRLEETSNQRFIRSLLNFYKPTSQRFCMVKLTDSHAKTFSRVGLLLIDFLLDPDDAMLVGSNILQELVQEIAECLQQFILTLELDLRESWSCDLLVHMAYYNEKAVQVISSMIQVLSPNMSNGVLSDNNLHNYSSRDYFLFLGKLSSSKTGSKLLDKSGIFQYLLDICSTSHDNLLKLIVSSLDYRDSGIARIILSKILTASSFHSRLYATSHMRVLLRSKIAFFNNWGMEFLVTQLYDTDPRIASEAADVLDEACEDEANLQYLVQLRPVLLHLGDKGIRLLTRFVSVERGFSYLTSLGYLEMLLDKWRQHYRLEYVRWVDELLAESLTTYTKPVNDEGYVRRSNKKQMVRDVFLPPHLYGELVQKKIGFKVLQKTNDIEECVKVIRDLEPDSLENVTQIKSALWALGHCGSSNWGITLLMEEDVIPDIVRMAEECENFAIRGTCYYVLGLTAKTRQGAEILNDLEWVSIRHIGNEEWPVVESKDLEIPAMVLASPTPSPTYSAFNLGKISESNDNGIYLGEEPKKTTDSSYDELSGIYLGEDTTSKKVAKEEKTEPGGILARWYADAERRRKIATRESGLYDDASGVYIGNENAPQKSLLDQENFVPGGIMAKLYQDASFGKTKESKHKRNLSEGNFSSSTGLLNEAGKERDSKRRTYSNVDHVEPLNVEFTDDRAKMARQEPGAFMKHVRSSSTISEDSLTIDNKDAKEGIEQSTPRNRYDSSCSELTIPTGHVRTDSNVSSVSESSIDYQDASSMDPSYSSIGEFDESPATKPSAIIDDHRVINPPPLRLTARVGSESGQNEAEGRLTVDDDQKRAILTRQRSISMTEKHRTKSPTLALIAENRSSSFHGSTEFSKITSSKRATSDMQSSGHSTGTDDGLSSTSSSSLAEVKILSDKTIVFRTGMEKDRSLSFDSAQVSDLRRDRLLVTSQINEPEMESGSFKARSRTSSCEKAELARKLGLKSGDISQRSFGRSRSTSSGYGSDIYLRKKIINKNSLLGNTEHVTVSGDSNKNARSLSDVGNYTTMRDASGYVALSTLRRQYSLNREALTSTTNYNRPIFTAGPAVTDLSLMNTRDTLSSSTNSYEFRQLASSMSSSSTGTEFLGLCLPLNLSSFFQVEPYDYQGSWADHFISDPRTVGVVNNPEEPEGISDEHEPSRCLGCMYSKRTKSMSERRKSIDSMTDPDKISYRNENDENTSEDSTSTSFASSVGQENEEEAGSKNLDESSPRGRVLIRKEVLRLVVKLSSAVGSKSHQEGLLQLKSRFPHIFQDLCMFCEVIDLMSVYQFRLVIRRFLIHTLFDDVLFTEINERADSIASGGIQGNVTSNS